MSGAAQIGDLLILALAPWQIIVALLVLLLLFRMVYVAGFQAGIIDEARAGSSKPARPVEPEEKLPSLFD